ncbi:MAG: TetR family transcriptional regulator C-terminal domain-containing protein [Treponema sp.]|jgi:hypothetical protein|nr:TetR family transcriptional regulator C-terminal domain-containing protein [Treponema sp.]
MQKTSGKPVGKDTYECYSVFKIYGTVGLMRHWLKNDMHIPIPEMAKILEPVPKPPERIEKAKET